eukprot:scaffold132879_cov16-Tisochrysis_lutea.AAC.5
MAVSAHQHSTGQDTSIDVQRLKGDAEVSCLPRAGNPYSAGGLGLFQMVSRLIAHTSTMPMLMYDRSSSRKPPKPGPSSPIPASAATLSPARLWCTSMPPAAACWLVVVASSFFTSGLSPKACTSSASPSSSSTSGRGVGTRCGASIAFGVRTRTGALSGLSPLPASPSLLRFS